MAHHWSDGMNQQMSQEEFDKLFAKKSDQPGATGKFPDGKMDPLDEGQLQIGMTTMQGRVVIEFGKPVSTIGFTKDEALNIGQQLIERALKL